MSVELLKRYPYLYTYDAMKLNSIKCVGIFDSDYGFAMNASLLFAMSITVALVDRLNCAERRMWKKDYAFYVRCWRFGPAKNASFGIHRCE